jgi:hypothetical protein
MEFEITQPSWFLFTQRALAECIGDLSPTELMLTAGPVAQKCTVTNPAPAARCGRHLSIATCYYNMCDLGIDGQ